MRKLAALDRVVWPIFGAGFFAVAFLYPGIALFLGLLEPLGWTADAATSFERCAVFARSGAGRILVLAAITLPLWNGAFHLRHTGMDLLGTAADRYLAPVLYITAVLGTAVAVVGLLRL